MYGDEPFRQRLGQLVRIAGNPNALANKCGVTQSSVCAFLKRGNPPRRSLLLIANGMKVRLEWLMCGFGSMTDSME